jgi:UDP-3-O-[3-hydroxymyristoyl] N-acetylglucosamine deacetylase
MFQHQTTISKTIRVQGVGLHSGEQVQVVVRPAPVGTGIVFVRTDLIKAVMIEAKVENVVSTALATTLGCNGASLGTVEHVLSAIYALGLSNLFIDVNGSEVPVLDGSAGVWVDAIVDAGLVYQRAPVSRLVIKKEIEVRDGDKVAKLTPRGNKEPGLHIRCSIYFEHPLIENQLQSLHLTPEKFAREVAQARTFGFKHDVDALQKAGLGLGGSLDNAVVLDGYCVLNDEGLRYADEFVRHKLLDAVGDLALVGMPIDGCLVVHKAGHALHTELAKCLLSQPDAFEVKTYESHSVPLRTTWNPLIAIPVGLDESPEAA